MQTSFLAIPILFAFNDTAMAEERSLEANNLALSVGGVHWERRFIVVF
jgi:hypothetical protein